MIKSLKKNETFEYQKLSKDEMTKRGILGRLVGPCADFVNPTRNGRKYGEDLWEKVFSDPLMEERIKNGVCFGELGHPTDRTETDMKEIAVALREKPTKNDKGQLIACFDILDTPNGRILKTLCDYGSTVGISSRGTGDVIQDDRGEDIVDPNTYDCECWDVVLTPAVETARLQYVTESLDNKGLNLKKALTEELNAASADERKVMEAKLQELKIDIEKDGESKKQLDKFIKTVNSGVSLKDFSEELDVQDIKYSLGNDGLSVSQEDFDIATSILMDLESELDESIKKESIPEKGGDIKPKDKTEEAKNDGSEELIKGLQEALKVKVSLEAKVKSLQETLAANDIRAGKVTEELGRYKKAIARLTTVVSEKTKLQEKVSTLEEDLKTKEQAIGSLKQRIEKLSEVRKSEPVVDAKPITEAISVKDAEIVKLNESLKTQKAGYDDQISKLNESIKTLKADSESKEQEHSKKIVRVEKLKESYKKLATDTMSRYIETKAGMLGVTTNEIKNKLPESYSVDDVDEICEDLKSYELNISKLPFSIDRKVKVKVHESKNESLRVNNGVDDDIDESLLSLAGLKK